MKNVCFFYFVMLIFSIFALLFLTPGICGAKEWFVRSENDISPQTPISDEGLLTLRQAVENAAHGDTIVLSNPSVVVSKGEIIIRKNLTIRSSGAHSVIHRNSVSFLPSIGLLRVQDSHVVFDSIHFKNARVSENSGGAVFLENSSAIFKNCRFLENKAPEGAALYIKNSDVTVENSYIALNKVESDSSDISGGSVFSENSTVTLNNVLFEGNTAEFGPSAFIKSGTVFFKNCRFYEKDSSSKNGGSVYIQKGGSGIFENCTFSENTAVFGGSVYSAGNMSFSLCYFTGNKALSDKQTPFGGALYVSETGSCDIKDSVFEKNQASLINDFGFGIGSGGAIYCSPSSSASVRNTSFYENYARYGGAIYTNGAVTAVNGTFYQNHAKETGGAVAVYSKGSVILEDSILLSNIADGKGGGQNGGGGLFVASVVDLKNNIIMQNKDKSNLDVFCENGKVVSRGNNSIQKTLGFPFPQVETDASGDHLLLSDLIVSNNTSYLIPTGRYAGASQRSTPILRTIRKMREPPAPPISLTPSPLPSESPTPSSDPDTSSPEIPNEIGKIIKTIPGFTFYSGLMSSLVLFALIEMRKINKKKKK